MGPAEGSWPALWVLSQQFKDPYSNQAWWNRREFLWAESTAKLESRSGLLVYACSKSTCHLLASSSSNELKDSPSLVVISQKESSALKWLSSSYSCSEPFPAVSNAKFENWSELASPSFQLQHVFSHMHAPVHSACLCVFGGNFECAVIYESYTMYVFEKNSQTSTRNFINDGGLFWPPLGVYEF